MRIALILLVVSLPAMAIESWQVTESRYCGQPARDAAGNIKRSSAVRSAFQRAHPCPVTKLTYGTCTGWQIDHVIPLASCGCDAVFNMQWLPVEIKTAAGTVAKDRWERTVYTCPEGTSDASGMATPP